MRRNLELEIRQEIIELHRKYRVFKVEYLEMIKE